MLTPRSISPSSLFTEDVAHFVPSSGPNSFLVHLLIPSDLPQPSAELPPPCLPGLGDREAQTILAPPTPCQLGIPNAGCSPAAPHLLEEQRDKEFGQDGSSLQCMAPQDGSTPAARGCRRQLCGDIISAPGLKASFIQAPYASRTVLPSAAGFFKNMYLLIRDRPRPGNPFQRRR